MKFSKHISIYVAIALLASSLQSQTVRGNYIKNLPNSVKSIDNGGTLTAAQAHTDGIGVIIVDEALDNSAYNTLANKYATGTNKLIEHVLLDASISAVDKALALSLLADTPDGTACDDGNAATFGETYLIGVCQGGVTNGSSCDDGNALTFGETYLSGVCQNGFTNGTSCDDGNALTFGETYLSGVCQGGVTNGTPCDDGNAATSSDVYTNGICVGIAGVVPTAKYATSNSGAGVPGYIAGESVNAYRDATAKSAGTATLNGMIGIWDGTYWKPQGDTTKVLSGDFLVQIPLTDVGGVAGNGLVYTNTSGVFASTYRLSTYFGVTAWYSNSGTYINMNWGATNICRDRGMLLPTYAETTITSTNAYNPMGGTGNVGGTGVPTHPSNWTWTSTSYGDINTRFFVWYGASQSSPDSSGSYYVRCVR